jgi:hypothetical protein
MSAYLGRHPASKGCYLVEILPILGYVIVPLMMMMMMMMFYVLRHMEDERIVTALTVLMNINFPMPGGGGGGGDPLVRPPPQTLEDLEDLTGEPGEVHQTRTNAPTRVAPPDRSKVHFSPDKCHRTALSNFPRSCQTREKLGKTIKQYKSW